MEPGFKPGVFDSRVHDREAEWGLGLGCGAPQSSRGGHQTQEPILCDCG